MIPDADKDTWLSELRKRLLCWFQMNKRELPWRTKYSPYEIWISEIMLQQTQVKTVLPYYLRWMERFEDVRSVAAASDDELLRYWEGLGYYSRVGNLHKTAKILVDKFDGNFPREYSQILNLPGIGPYTAGAIMSLAFNENLPIIDGNIQRLFARLFNVSTPVKGTENQKFMWEKAAQLIPAGEARNFNQGLMELGALVCTPKNPICRECPLIEFCESFKFNVVNQRPVPSERKKIKQIEAAVGVLVEKGRIFIQKRPENGLMARLWEFPGGKLEAEERPEDALVREFLEELGLHVSCLDKITTIRHAYTDFRVTLHAFSCRLLKPCHKPLLRAASEARWVTREQLDEFAFPAANRRLIRILAERSQFFEND